ncbi:MAG TPA: tetratricopeptide repeat protein [Methylomirabilota bacterium]|nr:tetratricopeptide repeat protein [Methylomirabilota bacterium]
MTETEALAALRGDDRARVAQAEAALWAMWCRSGRPELDAELAEAVAAMERHDFSGAERRLSRLVERMPAWAEAWNKRATVRYLARDYAGSIADCAETLARKPHHFGALAGQGLCHMALGQYTPAAAMFRRALAVHPHLAAVRRNLRSALAEVVRFN